MENKSVKLNAGSRTFYFDVRADKQGNRYVSIAEVPNSNSKRQRHRIFIYEEDLEKFREALADAIKLVKVKV